MLNQDYGDILSAFSNQRPAKRLGLIELSDSQLRIVKDELRQLADQHAQLLKSKTDQRVEDMEQDDQRYCQKLWIGCSSHAATFSPFPSASSPLTNFAPALTRAAR